MIGGDGGGGEGGSIKIDTTLTKRGFAADARAVGEALGKKIAAPSTANVGQTIVVEAVDENGKPTTWKAVDMSGDVLNKMYVNVREYKGNVTKDRVFEEIKNHIDNGGEAEVLYLNAMSGSPVKYNFSLYSIDTSEVKFYRTRVFNAYGDHYRVETEIITIQSDESVSTSTVHYPVTYEITRDNSQAVASGAVFNYAVPIPANVAIGQTVVLKAIDNYGKPVEWEAVDMPEAVMVDPTLTAEGAAADAKAAGDAIVQKSQVQIITWEEDD